MDEDRATKVHYWRWRVGGRGSDKEGDRWRWGKQLPDSASLSRAENAPRMSVTCIGHICVLHSRNEED